jgi:Uncharacterised protein family UPF0564
LDKQSRNHYATTVQNNKKGKYGVTIPQPFMFDIREKVKPKTIREQKIEEMLEEKRIAESQGTIFRCKPIPS